MPGYSSVPIVADAYLKGFKGFDPERAFQAMTGTATNKNRMPCLMYWKKDISPVIKCMKRLPSPWNMLLMTGGIALMAKENG